MLTRKPVTLRQKLHATLPRHFVLPVLLLLIVYASVAAQQRPVIDGDFRDWDGYEPVHLDAPGDGASSGVDFRILKLASDDKWLYVYIEVTVELNIQQDNAIRLNIDTDSDVSTGVGVGGLGIDLMWNFGFREGRLYQSSGSAIIGHADIRFIPAPSISSDRFEFAISRAAEVNGEPVFPSGSLLLMFNDIVSGGDRLPDRDGGVEFRFDQTQYPSVERRPVGAKPDGSVRLLSWNVLFNGPFDDDREPSFTRVLQALAPDILCFQECFDVSAAEMQTYIRRILPSPQQTVWRAFKVDAGNITVTHYDVRESLGVQEGFRESAHLLALRDHGGSELLLFNNHLRCCGADENRQREADGLIAFIREAKRAGGDLTLSEGTPIMLVGDFNLVGDRRQLETLLTGDILDNNTYGPDEAPGWDGNALLSLQSRKPATLATYTWREDESSFAPGKLDYILYTGSALSLVGDVIFDTSELTEAELAAMNLRSDDTDIASDHLPFMVDFVPGSISEVLEPSRPSGIEVQAWPNPVREELTVSVSSRPGESIRLQLVDVLGRVAIQRTILSAQPTTNLRLMTGDFPAGVYHLVVSDRKTRTVMKILKSIY